MNRLTFEFPTPVSAAAFAEDSGGTQQHRVVDVETRDEEECRELARRHGGREER